MPEVQYDTCRLHTTVSLGLDCNKRKIGCLAYDVVEVREWCKAHSLVNLHTYQKKSDRRPEATHHARLLTKDSVGLRKKNRLDEHLIWNDSHFQVRQMVQHREDIPLTGSISPLGRKRFFFLVYIESVGWALTVLYTMMRIKNVCRQTQRLF